MTRTDSISVAERQRVVGVVFGEVDSPWAIATRARSTCATIRCHPVALERFHRPIGERLPDRRRASAIGTRGVRLRMHFAPDLPHLPGLLACRSSGCHIIGGDGGIRQRGVHRIPVEAAHRRRHLDPLPRQLRALHRYHRDRSARCSRTAKPRTCVMPSCAACASAVTAFALAAAAARSPRCQARYSEPAAAHTRDEPIADGLGQAQTFCGITRVWHRVARSRPPPTPATAGPGSSRQWSPKARARSIVSAM